MFSKILHWINDRWPLNAVIRWGLEEEMPGGTGFAMPLVVAFCWCYSPRSPQIYGSCFITDRGMYDFDENHGWGNQDLLPGVKVNGGAVGRSIQLV